jgi:hypothetical protein
MWDFAMDKSGAGAGFLRELRFPLPIFIPPISFSNIININNEEASLCIIDYGM